MADLNQLDAAQTVKLAGADSSGTELSFVKSTTNNELNTADLINTTAVQTTLTVGTTAVAARVGGSNLSGRKLLIIQVQTGNIVWGFDSGSQPFTIANGASLYLSVGDSITVYIRRTSGSGNVVVAELS